MADRVIDAAVEVKVPGGVDCAILWGHLQDPDPDNHNKVRLYISTDLDEYLLISNADKIHVMDLYNDSAPLAGSLVWVKADAQILRVREETASQEGAYLKGAIERGFLGQFQVFPLLGLDKIATNSIDPTSGGGCGTGSTLTTCH